MKFRQLSLEEYRKLNNSSFLEELRKKGNPPLLEERLEKNTAKYYIVNYNNEEFSFWFYKQGDVVDLCLEEKNPNSLFDYEPAVLEIFDFLSKNGYKKVLINLYKDKFSERNNLAIKYGFTKVNEITYKDITFIEYEKKL